MPVHKKRNGLNISCVGLLISKWPLQSDEIFWVISLELADISFRLMASDSKVQEDDDYISLQSVARPISYEDEDEEDYVSMNSFIEKWVQWYSNIIDYKWSSQGWQRRS